MPDLTGQTVAGYPLERLLTAGPYAEFYQAQTAAEPIGVKVLRGELQNDQALNDAVAASWGKVGAVTHGNLLTILGSGVDPRFGAYCLTELVKARPLRQIVLDGAKLSWREGLVIAGEIVAGLEALHSAGFCHGLLTPFHVWLTTDMDVKLEGAADFSRVDRPLTELLAPQILAQLPPERLRGGRPSRAADLYGLGVCLYFLLAGHDPFTGRDVESVTKAVTENAPMPPQEDRADIPEDGLHFLVRLLEKEPAKRYGHLEDVRAAVAALKAGEPLPPFRSRHPATVTRVTRFMVPGPAVAAPAPEPTAAPAVAPIPAAAPAAAEASAGPTAEKAPQPAAPLRPRAAGTVVGGLRPGGHTAAFGDLRTHVLSTIPLTEKEREGDDLFRSGQLNAALIAWRAAMATGPQHPPLKVKIEKAERELRKLEFEASLQETQLALGAKNFAMALQHARKAVKLAESDEDQAKAGAFEVEANRLLQQRRSLTGIGQIALLLALLALVFWLLGWGLIRAIREKPGPEGPEGPPPAGEKP